MRRAYELAFADASIFLKSRSANLLSMDEVIFQRPVHVGSLLKLTSHIVYAEGYPHRSFQVSNVEAVLTCFQTSFPFILIPKRVGASSC
jgi:acyl-coenzyme A thioesterase 9